MSGSLPVPPSSENTTLINVHPLTVRITHWVNVAAILIMVASGWRIYNASPLFNFTFPNDLTLGGWLAGALQWHFAAMWLLAVNGLVYLAHGIFSGHYRQHLLPITVKSLLREIANTTSGRLSHAVGTYNPVQRTAYLSVIVMIILVVLSGLVMWKPVQLQSLGVLLGGYEGARLVHFFTMTGIVSFVVIHVVMVMWVPRTFIPMWTGRVRQPGKRS